MRNGWKKNGEKYIQEMNGNRLELLRSLIIKKSKKRIVLMPDNRTKDVLSATKMELIELYNDYAVDNKNIYGFLPNRNCVDNAQRHLGQKYCLSLDIKDFFPSIMPSHVDNIINHKHIDLCFVDGQLPQGLPTSPIISNIAFYEADWEIQQRIKLISQEIIYSRYADDLSFSFNDKTLAKKIYSTIKTILLNYGFLLNYSKTKLNKQPFQFSVTGIRVFNNELYVSRRTFKRLRASIRNNNFKATNGLTNWMSYINSRNYDD